MNWCSAPLSARGFRVPLKNDTSILFRTRFEANLWYFYPPPPEVRSWSFDLLVCSLDWTYTGLPIKLGSIPVLHLKPIKLDPVLVLHLKASQTRFCFGLTLESRSNLVLFRSYTWSRSNLILFRSYPWKPIKLVISNFVICLLIWTYPSLPAWLRFCLCRACLFNWTYNSNANFIFSSGLTSGCQLFSSSFYLPGLTSECQTKETSNPAQLGFGPL